MPFTQEELLFLKMIVEEYTGEDRDDSIDGLVEKIEWMMTQAQPSENDDL
jgi:hypothetical protein